MKKSFLNLLLIMVLCVSSTLAWADVVSYFAIATHPCAITDYVGTMVFDDKRSEGGGYYCAEYGASEVTSLSVNDSGNNSEVTANEPKGLRFKGWWTKAGGWTNFETPQVSEIGILLEDKPTITGATIKNAGTWYGSPIVVAKYVPIYAIATEVSPADAGSVTGSGTYEEGSAATLKATAKSGWAFDKWEDGRTDNPRTLSNISADATYTAVFKSLSKRVTLDKTGGSGGTDWIVVTNGLPMPKIAVPTRTGYAFLGYFTSASGDDATQYYTSSGTSATNWKADEGATALFARWQAKTLTVRFFNDGATSGPDPMKVTYGTDPGPLNVIPTKADYKFVGYYLGSACYWDASGKWVGGSFWTYIPEEGDVVTLTAQYVADQYAVKFDANGGTGSYDDLSVVVDAEFALPDGKILSKTHHRFGGWALSSEGAKAYDGGAATTVAANKSAASQNPNQLTFYAVWIDLSCTARFNVGSDEATVEPETKPVEAGAPFGELATATWTGDRCTLVGWWSKDGEHVTETSIVPEGVSTVDLFARWTTNGYSIAFQENGGSGTMSAQILPFYTSVALSPNRFVREGYQFAGWTTNATEAATYADGDTVRDLATTKDEVVDLYAKWSANDYTVAFFGNGGTNAMAAQSFTYDAEQEISSNRFVREGFTFAGWATDPTNGVAYADGAPVKNLTAVDGAVVPLYAKWTSNGGEVVSDFSKALDCSDVNFNPAEKDELFSTVSDGSARGGTCVKICVEKGRVSGKYTLQGTVPCGGRLIFSYKTEIFDTEDDKLTTQFGCLDAAPLALTSEWMVQTQAVESAAEAILGWQLKRLNEDGWDYEDSDDDYVLIDNVRWEPAETNAMTVGVTFRDVTGGVFSNATYVAGEALGALPVLKNGDGEACVWTYDGHAVNAGWTVPAAANGVELLPGWGVEPPEEHPIPEAKDAVTISSAAVADGKFSLSFKSDEKFDYNLLTNANLLIDSWGVMATEKGTGESITFGPLVIDGLPQLFYKVETIQRKD